jgi:ATP-dependent DNA helicase DinG
MEKVYADLKPLLADAGLDLECQDKGSSSQYLSRRFIEDKKLSLLALKSFWEGFDATGDTLRCVVIPKLPFASPQDPLVCERDFREERAWWKYSLPEAVLAVKQAAGRLIRTSTDTGILVLADSRLVTKRYGSTFIKSLPSTQVQQVEQERVGEYIRLWRQSHKA